MASINETAFVELTNRLMGLPGEAGEKVRRAAEAIGWRVGAGGNSAQRWQRLPHVQRLSVLVEAAGAMPVRMASDSNPWTAYQGPRGGHGWKRSDTGDVRYQTDRPAAHETGSSEEPESSSTSPAHEKHEFDANETDSVAFQHGDRSAGDKLIRNNGGMIYNLAKRFARRPDDMDDLQQEARAALLDAARAFDPSRGFQFSTLASRVIMNRLGRVSKMAGKRAPVWKQQSDTGEEGNQRPLAEPSVQPDELPTEQREQWEAIRKAVSTLPERVQTIVERHYGLDGRPPETAVDIANKLGVSKQRVSQILQKAVDSMRDNLQDFAVRLSNDVNPWTEYRGPRGGKGWKHSGTGDIRYGGDRPGANETGGSGEETPSHLHRTAKSHLKESPHEQMTQDQFSKILNNLLDEPEKYGVDDAYADRLEQAVTAIHGHVNHRATPAEVKKWWHDMKPHEKLDVIDSLMFGVHNTKAEFKKALAQKHGGTSDVQLEAVGGGSGSGGVSGGEPSGSDGEKRGVAGTGRGTSKGRGPRKLRQGTGVAGDAGDGEVGSGGDAAADSGGTGTGGHAGGIGPNPQQPDTSRIEEVLSQPAEPETPTDLSAGNWRYHSRDFYKGGLKAKFRGNVAAIEAIRNMRNEGRTEATPEEQAAISKFIGWGQFPALFNDYVHDYREKTQREKEQKAIDEAYDPKDWKKERAELKALLTQAEWDSARKSTLNGHYTHPDIVDAHWRMAQRLGFNGGKFLETSAGVGYYLGMMPAELAAKTRSSAVELESMTGSMLQALYPSTNVQVQGFEKYQAPDNFYELVASNVPFGDYTLHESRYNKYQAPIHDHFFLKSADLAKPGGLIMHVTSTGTLDKTDDATRKRLAEQCELVAAYRLPGDTHQENAGTSVVTDMIVLRKKIPGLEPAGEDTPSEAQPKGEGFTGVTIDSLGRLYHWKDGKRVPAPDWTGTTAVPDPDGGDEIRVNSYFAANPQNVLGRLDRTGTMYRGASENVSLASPEELTAALGREVKIEVDAESGKRKFVFADSGETVPASDIRRVGQELFKKRLEDAIGRLPEGAFRPDQGSKEAFEPERLPAPGDVRDGGYTVRDGKLFRRTGGELTEMPTRGDTVERVSGILQVRDIGRAIILKELKGEDAAAERGQLNAAYDGFIAKFGPLNSKENVRLMRCDPDSYFIQAMEKWNAKEETAKKADIFAKATTGTVEEATSADNVSDGLMASLRKFGSVNVDHMAELMGASKEEVEQQLADSGIAFKDPQTGWQMAELYLSGNVRRKLILAKAAAAADPSYAVNVAALEKVQPEDVDYTEITPKLGAPWIPPADIAQFANELLEVRRGDEAITVKYSPDLNEWVADWTGKGKRMYSTRPQSTQVWGTPDANTLDCLRAALDGRSITIKGGTDGYEDDNGELHEFDAYDKDGNAVVNRRATADANAKVQEMKEKFKEWLWEDDDRTKRLERYYNDNFNNIRDVHYDGQHQQFPGMNPEIRERIHPHIKDFVWRVVQTGTGLAAHEVGTGKTYAMIAAAMELRRLGLAKKPIIACLKANIGDITKDALELYPGAKILSTAGAYDAESRQRIISQMATGDYDICLLTHDQLNKLKMQPEVEAKYLHGRIAEMRAARIAAAADDPKKGNRIVKALENAEAKMQARLEKVLNPEKKDTAMSFEQVGCDQIFVDECFPGDAVVDTDRGPMTIAQIVDGELSVSVLSCNRATHELEYMPVVSWFKRQLRNHLVEVRHEHGKFICTPNHNIWTEEDGYVQAGLLKGSHTLRVVSKGVCADKSEGVLFEKVLSPSEMESQGVSRKGCCGDAGDANRGIQEGVIGENEKTQSDGESGDQRESAAVIAWQAILESGRQRETLAGAAATTGIRPGVDDGVCGCNEDGQAAISENPELLQGGHCTSGTESGNRSGRLHAQNDDREAAGRTERRGFVASRVVCVALHQRAGDERTFSGGTGDNCVYDIEVSGNHNYFANGVNVSNSHQYKSLQVITRQQRVKGIPTGESQRAANMLMRTQWLQEQNGGRGVVFATGTPISNTLAELYNVQRYLQPQELHERGVDHFDAWVATFGDISSKTEFTVTGEYKPTNRLRAYTNIPELMNITRQMMDTVRADDLKRTNPETGKEEKIIKRPTRKDQFVTTPNSPAMQGLMASLVARAKAIAQRKGPPEKGDDNMLVICTDGRKGAVDMRLLDDNAPDDPDSKTNQAVRKMLELHHGNPGGTQILFSDIGVNPQKGTVGSEAPNFATGETDDKGEKAEKVEKDDLERITQGDDFTDANLGSKGRFSLYGDIIDKLVKGGIPRDQIADFSKLEGNKRKAAIEAMQRGDIRIALGSTQRLGTGCNVQNKIIAMHHLDVPWVPASVEQRDGRGWRHGNENKEVGIYRYVAEGSLDQKFWDIVGSKLRFQDQVLHNRRSNLRTAEDDDSEVLTPEQLMAVASGDVRQLRRVDLEEEVKSLKSASSRHEREQRRIQQAIEKVKAEQPGLEKEEKELTEDIDHLAQHGEFEWTTPEVPAVVPRYYERDVQPRDAVPSQKITKKDEAETALQERLKTAKEAWDKHLTQADSPYAASYFRPHEIGEFRGMPVKYNPSKHGSNEVILEGPSGQEYRAKATIASMEYVARDLERRREFNRQFLESGKKQIESASSNLGKKFTKEKELKEKSKELEKLVEEIEGKKKGKKPPKTTQKSEPVTDYEDDIDDDDVDADITPPPVPVAPPPAPRPVQPPPAPAPASRPTHHVLSGNTYANKDEIKRLGGRWDADRKVWKVALASTPEGVAKQQEAFQRLKGVKVGQIGSVSMSLGEFALDPSHPDFVAGYDDALPRRMSAVASAVTSPCIAADRSAQFTDLLSKLLRIPGNNGNAIRMAADGIGWRLESSDRNAQRWQRLTALQRLEVLTGAALAMPK